MAKLLPLFVLAILSGSVLGRTFRKIRLPEDKEDLDDRYGWRPTRPYRPGVVRRRASTSPVPTTVPTPNVNEATTQSTFTQNCMRNCLVTYEYNPVCGSNNVTYDNPGCLYCEQACGIDVHLISSSRCPPPITVAPIA